MTRTNKKQQYINELEHDSNMYQDLLSSKGHFHWVHGKLISRYAASKRLEEITTELNKIHLDKTYKPWKAY